jgi:hypothetical protein
MCKRCLGIRFPNEFPKRRDELLDPQIDAFTAITELEPLDLELFSLFRAAASLFQHDLKKPFNCFVMKQLRVQQLVMKLAKLLVIGKQPVQGVLNSI